MDEMQQLRELQGYLIKRDKMQRYNNELYQTYLQQTEKELANTSEARTLQQTNTNLWKAKDLGVKQRKQFFLISRIMLIIIAIIGICVMYAISVGLVEKAYNDEVFGAHVNASLLFILASGVLGAVASTLTSTQLDENITLPLMWGWWGIGILAWIISIIQMIMSVGVGGIIGVIIAPILALFLALPLLSVLGVVLLMGAFISAIIIVVYIICEKYLQKELFNQKNIGACSDSYDSAWGNYDRKKKEIENNYYQKLYIAKKYDMTDIEGKIKNANVLPPNDKTTMMVNSIIWCIEQRYADNIKEAKNWLYQNKQNKEMQNKLNNMHAEVIATHQAADVASKQAQAAKVAADEAKESADAAKAKMDEGIDVRVHESIDVTVKSY